MLIDEGVHFVSLPSLVSHGNHNKVHKPDRGKEDDESIVEYATAWAESGVELEPKGKPQHDKDSNKGNDASESVIDTNEHACHVVRGLGTDEL